MTFLAALWTWERGVSSLLVTVSFHRPRLFDSTLRVTSVVVQAHSMPHQCHSSWVTYHCASFYMRHSRSTLPSRNLSMGCLFLPVWELWLLRRQPKSELPAMESFQRDTCRLGHHTMTGWALRSLGGRSMHLVNYQQ